MFVGDFVPKKKPPPDIYLLVAIKLGVELQEGCVIEDRCIGLAVARAAEMPCVVTKRSYTVGKDLGQAQKVVNLLEYPSITLVDLTRMVESTARGQLSGSKGRMTRLRNRYGSSYL